MIDSKTLETAFSFTSDEDHHFGYCDHCGERSDVAETTVSLTGFVHLEVDLCEPCQGVIDDQIEVNAVASRRPVPPKTNVIYVDFR